MNCASSGKVVHDPVDELRDALNELVELREENSELRQAVVQDAKTISQLRRRIGELMDEAYHPAPITQREDEERGSGHRPFA